MPEEIEDLSLEDLADKKFYICVNYHGGSVPYANIIDDLKYAGSYEKIYTVKLPLKGQGTI